MTAALAFFLIPTLAAFAVVADAARVERERAAAMRRHPSMWGAS